MNARLILGMAASFLVVCGCTLGPDYRAPKTEVPAAWSTPAAQGLAPGPAETARWWKSFGDSELDSLIDRAIRSNPDLAAAEARLRQSRAIRQLSSADLMPSLDASGSYAREKISRNQPLFGALPLPSGFPFEYSVYQAGFDASWEADLFGGQRRAVEAAVAEVQGAEAARDDARVSLVAEVARNYLELCGSQSRLEIAEQNVKLQEQAVALTQARFESGETSELDLTRAKALLAGLRAQLPPLQTSIRQAMYALATLIGKEPGALVGELSSARPIPPSPPEVPVGLPGDLLRRRPDVRQAERQLAAETARIGQAKSDWFPKLSLTGDAGFESVSASKWFEPGSQFWSVGPSLQWRALDFGRVKAEVKAQTAVQEAALANYEKTVLLSLQEAEGALTAYGQERIHREALAEQVAEDRRSLTMAQSLNAEGQVNYLDVLEAERSLYQAEDELAGSDEAVALDLVALYKALGGGWKA